MGRARVLKIQERKLKREKWQRRQMRCKIVGRAWLIGMTLALQQWVGWTEMALPLLLMGWQRH